LVVVIMYSYIMKYVALKEFDNCPLVIINAYSKIYSKIYSMIESRFSRLRLVISIFPWIYHTGRYESCLSCCSAFRIFPATLTLYSLLGDPPLQALSAPDRPARISIGVSTEIAVNYYSPSSSSMVSNATALSGSDA
jgi:hypothetical protein